MFVPWSVLVDPALTKADVLVYATVHSLKRAARDEVASATGLAADVVSISMARLMSREFLYETQEEPGVVRAYVSLSVAPPLSSPDPDQDQIREKENRVVVAPAVREKLRVTDIMASFTAEQGTGQWTTIGLLGLFYMLYQQEFSIEYKSKMGRASDLKLVELLIGQTGEALAEWCIRALFSPDMAWVKTKTLDFFTPANVSRHVVGIANELRKREGRRPDWKGNRDKGRGVVSRPGGEP